MATLEECLIRLRPGAGFTIDSGGVKWLTPGIYQPTKEEIEKAGEQIDAEKAEGAAARAALNAYADAGIGRDRLIYALIQKAIWNDGDNLERIREQLWPLLLKDYARALRARRL